VRETSDDEIAAIATDTPNGELLDVLFMDPLPITPLPARTRHALSVL
jgi:hypothetical protein